MSGLVMQASMERLMLKHGLSLQTPDIVPLSPPVDYALVLEGYASTCDNIDEERVKFAPFAFGDHTTVPPLLYDHNALEPAGKIEDLSYDEKGNLLVRCTVTHPKARRCGAFSIGAKVRDYEIRDQGSPNFYALVKRAILTDISLVERPVNPRALVKTRSRVPPPLEFYDLLTRRVAIAAQMTELMMKELRNDNR